MSFCLLISENARMTKFLSSGFPQVALDLSRRRDSVETRKTPSPYNSSNFGENSPPMHVSPSTTTSMSISHSHSHSRSGSHYPSSSDYLQSRMSTSYSNMYPAETKREPPSPTSYSKSQQSRAIVDDLTPYLTHSEALQQRIADAQRRTPSRESDESSDTSSINASINAPILQSMNTYPMVIGRDGKLSRPFKAYPRDPLSITASFRAAETLIDTQSVQKYATFRKEMLDRIHAANGGQPTVSNPKMRRFSSKTRDTNSSMDEFLSDSVNNNNNSDSSNGGVKDDAYYERRKKNNAAAKKSRDRRRMKEDEIAVRAAYLERENIELKIRLASVEKQLAMYSGIASS